MKSKTQLIKFTDLQKVTRKVTWGIYRPDKKSENNIGVSEMNFL